MSDSSEAQSHGNSERLHFCPIVKDRGKRVINKRVLLMYLQVMTTEVRDWMNTVLKE